MRKRPFERFCCVRFAVFTAWVFSLPFSALAQEVVPQTAPPPLQELTPQQQQAQTEALSDLPPAPATQDALPDLAPKVAPNGMPEERTPQDKTSPENLAPENLAPENLAPENLALENPAPVEPAKDAASENPAPKKIEWQGSLMFHQNDVNALKASWIGGMRRKGAAPAQAGKTGEAQQKKEVFSTTSFGDTQDVQEEMLHVSLNSILMYDSGEWTLWLNGQRFDKKAIKNTFQLGGSELKILKVSKRAVTLQWLPRAETMMLVEKRWKQMQQLSGAQKDNVAARDASVAFNDKDGTFVLTIRPNQTFSSEMMVVLEGIRAAPAKEAAQATPAASEGSVADAIGGVVVNPAHADEMDVSREKKVLNELRQHYLRR